MANEEETLGAALSEHVGEVGMRVRGVVVKADFEGLVIEVEGTPAGARPEIAVGLVRRQDLHPRLGKLGLQNLVGRVVEGLVTEVDPGGECLRLSPSALASEHFNDALRRRKKLRGWIVDVGWAGAFVEVDGLPGFVPRSQLSRREAKRYPYVVGRAWRGYVLDVSPKQCRMSSRHPWRRALRQLI